MKSIGISVTLISLLATCLIAGPAEQAWDAYLAGNFKLVETIFNESISDTSLTPQEQARLYLALGCSDAIRNRNAIAAHSFETALIIDKKMHLTASDLPPPVWKVFNPIQEKVRNQPATESNKPALQSGSELPLPRDTVKVYVEKRRDRMITLKSLVLPGWGHIAEGKSKGYLFAGSELALASGLVWAVVKTGQARRDYLDSQSESDISRNYNRYNNYYRLFWGLGFAFVVTYLGIQYDFFTSPLPISLSFNENTHHNRSISLTFRINLHNSVHKKLR